MALGDPEGEAANGGFRGGNCAVRARTVSFHFSITGKVMAHHRLAPSPGYGGRPGWGDLRCEETPTRSFLRRCGGRNPFAHVFALSDQSEGPMRKKWDQLAKVPQQAQKSLMRRLRKTIHDREMICAFHFLGRVANFRPRRCELARLRAEGGAFVGTHGEMQRYRQRGFEFDRGGSARDVMIEVQIGVHRAMDQRLQIVNAAQCHAADDATGIALKLRPVGRVQHRHQMSAGRVARERDARDRQFMRRAVGDDPCQRLPAILDHVADRHRRAQAIVDRGNTQSGTEKRFGQKGKIRFVERAPIAAVDEYQCATYIGRVEDIEPVARLGAISKIERAARGAAQKSRLAPPAIENGGVFGHQCAIVVFGFEGGVYAVHSIS